MSLRNIFIAIVSILFLSCGGNQKHTNGPIVLGDSSTIVTETDPKYLSDFVDDIQLQKPVIDTTPAIKEELPQPEVAKTETEPVPDKTQVAQEQPSTKNGLNVPFKEVTVFIPNIETRSYRNQNLEKANGASYQLTGGKLNGNQLQVSGATITRVSQRYITKVIAKNELGTLELDALNNTTEWTPLKGNGKTYTITGLNRPIAKKVTPAQIRLAVSRAAKNKRMSRQNIQKWERAVRSVRSLNQKPFTLVIRSVMWKIDGKDAKGKNFQKQLRVDLPV